MIDYLIFHAEQARLISFISILVLFAGLEFLMPRRKVNAQRPLRWTNNLGLVIFDSVLAKIILPASTIAIALYAENSQTGIFNHLLVPSFITTVICILILDALIYAQHILFHKIHWLWRFHRMHHSDTHIDVTTGIRFHPVEIILSLLIKFAAILLLGIPAIAVLLFEIILNVMAMITHSNLNLPNKLDKILRIIFVTPDMHRVHHSIHRDETDSNYGFNFSFWDKFFKTYVQKPKDTHEKMQIGLPQFRSPRDQFIDKLLTQPFREK